MRTITSKQLTDEYNQWIRQWGLSELNATGQRFGQYIMDKYSIGGGNSYFALDPFEAMVEILNESTPGTVLMDATAH